MLVPKCEKSTNMNCSQVTSAHVHHPYRTILTFKFMFRFSCTPHIINNDNKNAYHSDIKHV